VTLSVLFETSGDKDTHRIMNIFTCSGSLKQDGFPDIRQAVVYATAALLVYLRGLIYSQAGQIPEVNF